MKKIIVLVAASFISVLTMSVLTLVRSLHSPLMGKKLYAFMISADYNGSDDVVLQTKNNNCGPSALKMIFDHFNIPSTIDEIEINIQLTERGSSMLALKETAERKGLRVEGWKLSLYDLIIKPFPKVLFVNNDHYIVVDSIKNDEVFIRDPAIGRLEMKTNKLSKIWSGEALIFFN